MRNRSFKRVILGAAALTVLFAGSAFTASNTMTAVDGGVVGYGTTVVSGATVNAIEYTLDATGENVTSVALALNGDMSGSVAAIGFNGGNTTDCAAGVYDSTTETDFTCTVTTSTSTLASTEVVVN